MIVICKLDYTVLKTYYFIILFNTLSNAFEFIPINISSQNLSSFLLQLFGYITYYLYHICFILYN